MNHPFLDIPRTAPLLPVLVLAETATRYGITLEDLRSRRRTKTVSRARHHAAFALRDGLNMSWPEIARQLGLDHSSAMVGAKRFARACGLIGWRG